MSDNSHSTGSSGSSTNSWTLLSPEEAAVENVGPVDDGTESLGDVPSLSEEITGASGEFKPSSVSVETILSEEGHQVCQETSPESGEGPIPSSPSRMSPLLSNPADLTELESQPPVIHDIVTTSPSDHELLGATPFVTNMDLGASLDIPASEPLTSEPEESCSAPPQTEDPITTEQELDKFGDAGSILAGPAEESPDVSAEPVVSIPTETLTATVSSTHVDADISFAAEGTESSNQYKEALVTESLIDDGATKEKEKEEEEGEEEEAAAEYEEVDQDEKVIEDEGEEEEEEEEPSSSFDLGDTSGFDDGLRRRNVPSFDAPRPRTSDEEDDEEEVEFKLAEKKEEKSWLSVNKCIVGALILLFLGSLFLSGDFDDAELSDGEQSQDWLSGDPQDMKELLDKLTQENQQIAQLEAQLQSQKEQLDLALQAVASSGDEAGKAGLEIENTKLRAELSSLPELKKELESLKARVTELSQLTADQEMPPATSAPQSGEKNGQSNQKAAGPDRRKDANKKGHWKEELKRQKILLEESGKRLDGMRKNDGDRKKVRDNLEAIQKKLSEKVDRWGEKKEPKWKGDKAKSKERDHWKKDEKKKRKGEKEWKQGKEGGWREKEEKKEKERKQNSHKEAWRKHQDEWERKKGERKMDREERRKEKPWHNRQDKNPHHHHHHHQHHHHHHQQQQQQQQRHQNNQNDFWRDQEEKLRRSIRPQLGCSSSEDCAGKEGLYPVELPEFDELLEGYLSKLEGSSSESKDKIRKLTAEFFEDGVFIHDRVRFSDFAEDVADILEDMVDVLEDGKRKGDDSLEEEMEEFEREALWKFSATA